MLFTADRVRAEGRLKEYQLAGKLFPVTVLALRVRQGPPLNAAVTNVQFEGPLVLVLVHCMKKPASVPSSLSLNPLTAMTAVENGAGKLTYFIAPGFPKASCGTMLEVMSTSFTYSSVTFVFTVNC